MPSRNALLRYFVIKLKPHERPPQVNGTALTFSYPEKFLI